MDLLSTRDKRMNSILGAEVQLLEGLRRQSLVPAACYSARRVAAADEGPQLMTNAPTVAELDALLARSKFLAAYQFRVESCASGECLIRAPYQAELDRPGGIVSGLTYMGAADVAMWLAIMTLGGDGGSWVTSDLKTAFLKSARSEDILCRARVLRAGRRTMYGTAECSNAAGDLLAHHVLSYALVK